ncbi:hypothetical protein [Kitasatospora sp. NPDC002965]|uniref:hypothetical protein n=1 Tax=Kitasatospora sp. NPDC002965 TaxID=3154775 RepID=UPI0033BDBB56
MTVSRRSLARTAAVAAAATSVLTLAVTPASAFSQSWGSGSYHASGDFVPPSGTITIGGQGCTDPRGIGVSTNTSYYLRWYGKDNGGNDASAPCATAHTA